MSDERPSIVELQRMVDRATIEEWILPVVSAADALLDIATAAALVLETHDSCGDRQTDAWLCACADARMALRTALAKVRP